MSDSDRIDLATTMLVVMVLAVLYAMTRLGLI